ncbi:MAG: toll/interleukin-1 receptor domain-containing protein [Longimicrobiaceae bacterium]
MHRIPSRHPVFISYARQASHTHALALYEALGGADGGVCYLDSADIESGEPFPEVLVDALLDARVVVVFPEPVYFTRDFCRLELEVASDPYARRMAGGAPVRECDEALNGIVLALPPEGVDQMHDRFPPLLRGVNWPSARSPGEVAAEVRRRLKDGPPTFRERYESLGELEFVRAMLLEGCRLLQPLGTAGIPFVAPPTMRETLGARFVGRAEDLWRVHQTLTTRRGDLKIAAGITGSVEAAGGFGKTQLAAEYVYRHATRTFRGGIFWIDAQRDPESQLYAVLRALHPDAPSMEALRPPHGDGVAAGVARVVRARPASAEPILFVIDNVPEPEEGEPPTPLRTWCPVPGEVSVLTTSRRSLGMDAGSVVRLEIRELKPEHAAMLLRRDLPSGTLSYAEWGEIADWVGHQPLGLELLNAQMRLGMPPRELLERSRRGGPAEGLDQAMEALRTSVPEGALRGITEALSVSYERLTHEGRTAARLVAWMAPAAVPEVVAQAFGPDVFTPAVRSVLRSRHLVSEVAGSGDHLGAMHRVIADFLRSRSPSPDPEAERVSGVLVGVMESARSTGGQGAATVRTCAPAALAHAAHRLARQADRDQFERALVFTQVAGTHLSAWGLWGPAADLLAGGRRACANVLGIEHPSTLSIMHNLAITIQDRGDLGGAQALQEEVLAACRRVLGVEHPDTFSSMNNLANILWRRGDLRGAQTIQEEVLAARRRFLDAEHPDTLSSMHNLAVTLSDRGDLGGAQALQEEVLEASRRVLGEEHPDTLTAMHNVAVTLKDRGDLKGAQALQEQVLEARRRLIGEEHPGTLSAMHNLAVTLKERGDLKGAQALQEQVLEASRRILGEEHPDTLSSMNNLALARSDRGDHTGAQVLHEQVLEVRLRLLGEEHPNTLSSMGNMASTLESRGNLAGAQTLYEQVLEARRRILGEEHPDTLGVMHNLAATLGSRGNLAGAQALQEQVLDASRRVLGEEHPQTLGVIHNLAHILARRGDLGGAQALQEQVLETRRRVLGDAHPDTLSEMYNLAVVANARGDWARARALMDEVVQGRRRLLGEEHPDSVIANYILLGLRMRGAVMGGWARCRKEMTRPFRWLRGILLPGKRP